MKKIKPRREATPFFMVALGLIITACSSDSIDEIDTYEKSNDSESVHILLSDTTIYEPDFSDMIPESSTPIYYSYDWNTPITRTSSDSYREYGYDYEEPESDWRKYSLNSTWQQYGITPGIYIARYVKIHKNLTILPNKEILTASYDAPNAPQNAMGWKGTTQNIGFTASPTTDYVADGVTRVFLINSSLAGVSLNRYIPANPSNFIWGYVLREREDIW